MSKSCQKNPIKFDKCIAIGYIIYMKAEWFCSQLGGLMTIFQSLSHIDTNETLDLYGDGDALPLFASIDPVQQWYAITPDRSQCVPCHNRSSAIAYATGRLPELKDDSGSLTYPCKAFVSPTGQYYIEAKAGSRTIRVDVANRSTALHYVRNGIDTSIAASSFNQ